jgi:hypothetical protein
LYPSFGLLTFYPASSRLISTTSRLAQPLALTGPAIVAASRKRGPKPRAELPDDAEADARVAAWFAKNIRPPGS